MYVKQNAQVNSTKKPPHKTVLDVTQLVQNVLVLMSMNVMPVKCLMLY